MSVEVCGARREAIERLYESVERMVSHAHDIQTLLEPFAAHIGGIQTWRDPTRLTILSHVRRRGNYPI